MAASRNKALILLMHDLLALRAYQGDSTSLHTCDARMPRKSCVRDDMFVTQSAGRGLWHTCDECLVLAARQSTYCTDDGRKYSW